MKLGIFDFFQDIKNFFKGGSVLGVDIGTTSVKIIELTKRGEDFKLVNYGILETRGYLEQTSRAIQTSSLKIVEDEGVRLLSLLLKDMKPKTHLAVASMPVFSVFTTIFDMPLLSYEETAKSVKFQAQQYVPIPINQVSVEWYKVQEMENQFGQKMQRIILVCTPNEIIDRYKNIFKKSGLKLLAIEIEPFAAVRALKHFLTNSTTLLVDIGAQSTSMTVVENDVIQQISQTDYSGIYLTQAISRSLDISLQRAEELKRRRGLSGGNIDSELSTLLLPFLDVIIQEVRRVKNIYEKQSGKKIEKLILSGGGANLVGIEKYFSNELKLTISHHSVFMGSGYPEDLELAMRELNNKFVISFGLTKKYFL